MNAREWMVDAGGERVTTEKLRADLRVLVADMEQLLDATATQTGQHVAQVRSNAVRVAPDPRRNGLRACRMRRSRRPARPGVKPTATCTPIRGR